MLIWTLFEALKTNNESERDRLLRQGSYWWRVWKEAAPSEVAASVKMEIVEGTGMYAEVLSTVISELGCNASSEDLNQGITQYILETTLFKRSLTYLETESYELGLISSLLLDQLEKDWKLKVEKGLSPLQLLLEKN